MPLELYFNAKGDRLYVTTANPGALHIFDIDSDPMKPKLLNSLDAGEGAHHISITKDERLAFVENALLNLPAMSEGTITVIDLENGKSCSHRRHAQGSGSQSEQHRTAAGMEQPGWSLTAD